MTTSSKVFRLQCALQNYPWGKDGSNSLVAQYGQEAGEPNFNIDESKAYAELWMGTHPDGPARLRDQPSVTLSEHLYAHPDLLGDAKDFPSPVNKPTGSHVPYLFKILTCKQALPLQIHPDKKLSEKLHKEDPEKYGDWNHKPEIAVAIEPFLGFAGFRPIEQIARSVKHIIEFNDLLSSDDAYKAFVSSPSSETLRPLFQALISLSSEYTKVPIQSLIARMDKEGEAALGDVPDRKDVAMVIKKLQGQYGADPGVFAASIFMNLCKLEPGEGIYVGADEAHAWLEGQIVELMATSNNVINVGFVPQDDKDSAELFGRAVTCTPRPASTYAIHSSVFSKGQSGKTTVYAVPTEEFSILHVPRNAKETLKPLSGPLIGIITEGQGQVGQASTTLLNVKRGAVVFVGAGTQLEISGGVEFWAAFYDSEVQEETGPS